MGTNSWPSGLSRCEPWAPTFSRSTTGCSQPSDVKYDMSVNGFECVEEEDGCVALVGISIDDDDEEEKVAAAVPFVVKSAAGRRSACGTKFVFPVRSARR